MSSLLSEQHATTVVGLRLFVHGGYDGSEWWDDLHVLDTQSSKWSELLGAGRLPSPRCCHTLNRVEDKLYLFGGFDGEKRVNTIDVLDIATQSWIQPKISGAVPEVTAAMCVCVFV